MSTTTTTKKKPASAAALDAEELDLRRRIAANNSEWNVQARRVLAFIQRLMREIDKLHDIEPYDSIREAWRAAGVMPDDDESALREIYTAEHVAEEVGGFGWALSHIENVLDCQTAACDRDPRGLR